MKSDIEMPALWQDTDSGIYYVNFRVPTDVVQSYGRTHVYESLRTRDKKEAVRKNRERWVECQKQFDRIRRDQTLAGPLTEESIPHLLEEWFHETLKRDESERSKGAAPTGFFDANENGGRWGGLSDQIDQLQEGYQSGNHPEFLVREAAWFLKDRNIQHDARTSVFAN